MVERAPILAPTRSSSQGPLDRGGKLNDTGPATPNFFLVGAFKAGTTALFTYLGRHPEIFISPWKEPAFFVPEFGVEHLNPRWRRETERAAAARERYLRDPRRDRPEPRGRVSRWEDYLRLFHGADPSRPIGEASVGYLWSASAASAIRERIPEARILMILRNPADRAFSQYIAVSPALIRESFSEAIRRSASSPQAPYLDSLDPLLDFGLYSEQVTRYLSVFPREQVLIHLYDDLVGDAGRVVRETFAFLGVSPDVPLNVSGRHNESRIPRFPLLERLARPVAGVLHGILPEGMRQLMRRARFRPRASVGMSEEDRRFRIDYYREDIRTLEGILGRDLSAWLR